MKASQWHTHIFEAIHVLKIEGDVEQGQEGIHKLELKTHTMPWL